MVHCAISKALNESMPKMRDSGVRRRVGREKCISKLSCYKLGNIKDELYYIEFVIFNRDFKSMPFFPKLKANIIGYMQTLENRSIHWPV